MKFENGSSVCDDLLGVRGWKDQYGNIDTRDGVV